VVNISRHLNAFPDEGIGRVLDNVFDFDRYDGPSRELLEEVMKRHSLPWSGGAKIDFQVILGEVKPLANPILGESWRHPNQSEAATATSCEVQIKEFKSRVRNLFDNLLMPGN
jgi:hypothetical protein